MSMKIRSKEGETWLFLCTIYLKNEMPKLRNELQGQHKSQNEFHEFWWRRTWKCKAIWGFLTSFGALILTKKCVFKGPRTHYIEIPLPSGVIKSSKSQRYAQINYGYGSDFYYIPVYVRWFLQNKIPKFPKWLLTKRLGQVIVLKHADKLFKHSTKLLKP